MRRLRSLSLPVLSQQAAAPDAPAPLRRRAGRDPGPGPAGPERPSAAPSARRPLPGVDPRPDRGNQSVHRSATSRWSTPRAPPPPAAASPPPRRTRRSGDLDDPTGSGEHHQPWGVRGGRDSQVHVLETPAAGRRATGQGDALPWFEPPPVAPGRDGAVVTDSRTGGTSLAGRPGGLPSRRAWVDGVLRDRPRGTLDERLGVADDPGQQSSDRLDHRQHRHLPLRT